MNYPKRLFIFWLTFVLGITAFSVSAAGHETNSTDKPGWTLVFQDEFEGDTIDSTKWNPYDPNLTSQNYYYYANSSETIVCPENVSQSDGYLHIRGENNPMVFEGSTHKYRTGTLQSRDKIELTYGLFEAKIKMPDLEGSNPAFWLMPHHDGNDFSFIGLGGYGAEIDILEHLYTDGTNYQTNLHWGGYEENHQSWGATPYMGNPFDWHIFAIEWTPTELKFMVDGNVTSTYTGEAVPYGPEFIILSLGMGGWIGEPNDSKLPSEMLVDYVRVYQRSTDLTNGTYNIKVLHSNKYLDIENTNVGSNVVQKTFNSSQTQQWYLERQDNGFYKIRNIATNTYLDVYGQQTQNGASVIHYSLTGNDNQLWSIELDDNNKWKIINRNSKKVLDIYGQWLTDNAPAIQYEDLEKDNQRFEITPVN